MSTVDIDCLSAYSTRDTAAGRASRSSQRTVEIVGSGELGIQRDEPMLPAVDVHHPEPSPPPPALPAPPAVSIQNAQAESVNDTAAHETQSPTRSSISLEEEGSRLRQRLKAAVMGATGHS